MEVEGNVGNAMHEIVRMLGHTIRILSIKQAKNEQTTIVMLQGGKMEPKCIEKPRYCKDQFNPIGVIKIQGYLNINMPTNMKHTFPQEQTSSYRLTWGTTPTNLT